MSETRGLLLGLIWLRRLNQSLKWYDSYHMTERRSLPLTRSYLCKFWAKASQSYHYKLAWPVTHIGLDRIGSAQSNKAPPIDYSTLRLTFVYGVRQKHKSIQGKLSSNWSPIFVHPKQRKFSNQWPRQQWCRQQPLWLLWIHNEEGLKHQRDLCLEKRSRKLIFERRNKIMGQKM